MVQQAAGILAGLSYLYGHCDLALGRRAISTRVMICNDDI